MDDSDDIVNDEEDENENVFWDDEKEPERKKLNRERYHEFSRSSEYIPFDYGASVNELFFSGTLNDVPEKLFPSLLDKAERQQPMTLLEKDFLEEAGMEIDSGEKNLYNR